MLTFMGVTFTLMFVLCALGIGAGWLVAYFKDREFRKFLDED